MAHIFVWEPERNPDPYTLKPEPQIQGGAAVPAGAGAEPSILNPKHQTPCHKPQTPHPTPHTPHLDTKPQTPNPTFLRERQRNPKPQIEGGAAVPAGAGAEPLGGAAQQHPPRALGLVRAAHVARRPPRTSSTPYPTHFLPTPSND